MRKHNEKVIKTLITLIAVFFGSISVNATNCSYVQKAELNELASKIKTNYETIEEELLEEFIDPDSDEVSMISTPKTTFKISIYNINKDLYINQHNELTNESTNIFYNDTKDGVYSFITGDIENIIKYSYKVHSNIDNCSGEVLKSYSFIKPKKNIYSQYRMCQGLEEVPYCKNYINEEIKISESELEEKLEEYLSKKQDKNAATEDQIFNKTVIENYKYIIIGIGIVIGTLGLIIVILKKRSTV